MFFRTLRAAALVAAASFALLGTSEAKNSHYAPARTFTVTLDGTLGPVLSGSDPAGLNGQSATVTVTVKESLNPYKTKANSASYHIPAGDITLTVNGSNYTSTSRSSMTVMLGKKSDRLSLKASVTVFGLQVKVQDASALQSGSWGSEVLQHPALFSPSPQDLTEPSSTFTYAVSGETTVLGVTGTASNSE
jgi:FlaG/FlaF family flagellin (archaellin)